MEIEEAFVTHLKSKTELTALTGSRIYPEETPQSVDLRTQSVVVYIKISDIKIHTLSGQDSLERPVFQFTAFAPTKAMARNILNQLKAALCDYQGAMDGFYIQKIEQISEISGIETSSDGTTRVYTESAEFEINYNKED